MGLPTKTALRRAPEWEILGALDLAAFTFGGIIALLLDRMPHGAQSSQKDLI